SPAMIAMVRLGKASLALYPDFVAEVEEISGMATGFRPKGTLQALFSRHAQEELSTIVALHHGLGLAAAPGSAEEARKVEPALREEMEAAVLRPAEAAIENRSLTDALLEAAKRGGAEVIAGAAVQGISRQGMRCDGLVLSTREKISAGHTVIAAGCFSAQ